MVDRIVLIVDKINYDIISCIDMQRRIPIEIVDVYEVDCPGAVFRNIVAKPIEKIVDVIKMGFNYIAGIMDFDNMLVGIVDKLNLGSRYIGLEIFKERYFDKYLKMQYLKIKTRHKCNDFANPALEIGDYTYCIGLEIFTGLDTYKCRIGRFCALSDNIKVLLGIDHRSDWNSIYPFNSFMKEFSSIIGYPSSKGDVIIGNDVWIGLDTVLLSGVTIGDGSVIGARSVVSKSVPPYCIAAGNPARVVRKRFTDEMENMMDKIKWWDWPDDKIYDAIPLLQSNNYEGLKDFWMKNINK